MSDTFKQKIIYLNKYYFKSIKELSDFFNISDRTFYKYTTDSNIKELPTKAFLNKIKNETDKEKLNFYKKFNLTYLDFKNNVSFESFKKKINSITNNRIEKLIHLQNDYYLYMYHDDNLIIETCTIFVDKEYNISFDFNSDSNLYIGKYNNNNIIFDNNQLLITFKPLNINNYYTLNLKTTYVNDEQLYLTGFLTYIENNIHITKKIIMNPFKINDVNKLDVLLRKRVIYFDDYHLKILNESYFNKNSFISKFDVLKFLSKFEDFVYRRVSDYVSIMENIENNIYMEFYKKEHKVLKFLSEKVCLEEEYIQDNILRTGETILRNISKYSNSCLMFTTISSYDSVFISNEDNKYNFKKTKEYMKATKQIFDSKPNFIFERIFYATSKELLIELYPIIRELLETKVIVYIYIDNIHNLKYTEMALNIECDFSAYVFNKEIEEKSYITKDKKVINDLFEEYQNIKKSSNCHKVRLTPIENYENFINKIFI